MSTAQGMKRRREDPNTVLRPMSNSNESENERSQITGNMNRTKKVRFQPPEPPLLTAAVSLARTQQRNMINLQTLRNSLPRGIVNQFTNNKLQNAINNGRYQAMKNKIQAKIRQANQDETAIKVQLRQLPSGNFRNRVVNKINNVIGNTSKTGDLLQQIKNEQNRIKAAARKQRITNLLRNLPNGNFRKNVNNEINNAIGNNNKTNALLQKIQIEKNRINAANRAAANRAAANRAAANKAAANKAAANKAAANKATIVNLRQKKKAAAAKAAANKAAANKAVLNKAIAEKRQRNANELNMLRKEAAKAKAEAAAKAKAEAEAAAQAEVNNRMSGRTSCPTSIGPLIQKLNNYKNTASSLPKSRGKKDKSPQILGTRDKVLLEILALTKENADNRNNVEGKKHIAYVFALLYDMFSVGLPKTFFRAKMKITRNSLITLAEHLMCVNTYSSSSNNFKAQEFTLTDMHITEFLFLMWLDGWHDDYNETSFETFLPTLAGNEGYFQNRYITNSWNIMKSIVPENPNNNINQNTLISKIINKINAIRPFIYDKTFKKEQEKAANSKSKNKTPKLKGKFETVLRDNITELLGYTMNTGNTTKQLPSINANNKHMVLLDMEGGEQRLSRTINNSPNLYPYLATASLIDPGRFKLLYYVLTNDITHIRNWIAEEKRNEALLDFNTRYHVGPTNIIFKDSRGNTFLDVNLTVNLRGVAQNNITKVNNNSFFTLKLNNKEVDIRTAAKNAKGAGIKTKMGKFMGDALQYMTVIVQNITRGRNRVFASGDGNACFMYMHLGKCIRQEPRIIIDHTTYTSYHGIE